MADRLFRVQDSEGRGPYRPGLSHRWSSPIGPVVLPWWTELKLDLRAAMALIPAGMHSGSAFRSMEQLADWFVPEEREKLAGLGYHIVRFKPHKIVAETPTQVVFAQNFPLSGLLHFAAVNAKRAA
jgi:hypothetical protein